MKKNKYIGLIFLSLLSLSACNLSDDYYETLMAQPELIKDYEPIYTVGDTLQIRGRFTDSLNLQIKVGSALAEIINIENKIQGQLDIYTHQVVKIRIKEDMGIGSNRPISITSSGITVEGTPIEIVEDSKSGVLKNELTVEKIADYPTGTVPVFCRNKAGNLYFVNKANCAVSKMTTDGDLHEVFNAAMLKDNDGTPFTVTRVNSAAVDAREQYLYLSVFTESTGAVLFHYYRLIRYGLTDGSLTVLNKTDYPRPQLKNWRTLEAAQPFEGDIAGVKMFNATAIYPANDGNIYFAMEGFFTHLDADGQYSYIFKSPASQSGTLREAPLILNPETKEYYTEQQSQSFFPGVLRSSSGIFDIDPDSKQYWGGNTSLISRIDFGRQIEVNSFSNHTSLSNPNRKLHISGSFPVLSGMTGGISTDRSVWGRMTMGEGKMLILYYQDSQKEEFPAWGVLDFNEERGYRYAPGAFDRKGYEMTFDDELLNYDGDGMLYMTANNRTVILKTIYK